MRQVRIICVLFVLLVLLSKLWGQGGYISVKISDPIDLSGISGASISAFGGEGDLMFEGTTDKNGKCLLTAEVFSADHMMINHPNYLPLDITIAEMKQHGMSLFLEVRSYELDQVVFSASKFEEQSSEVAQAIQVISAQEIAFENPQTSADLLAQQGAVFVQKSQMGGGSPNLRGFEANKVLLVLDGIRMNNAIYRSGHLQNVITIDPALVERTEVLFGPASVIYGSDALGGVMHFLTRKPEISGTGKFEQRTQADLRFSSANQEKRVHADVNLGWEKWASLTSFSFTDFGDLRTGKRGIEHVPPSWRRDSTISPKDGQDVIVPTQSPHILSPTGYSQIDLAQKFLFLQNDQVQHYLNLQYSTSTDIPRFDRLIQLRDDRLRFAEWYYGPQTRFLASYGLTIHQPNRLFDELSITTAYQHIEESRHSRSFQSSQRNHREERLHIGSINLDASKHLSKAHTFNYGAEFSFNEVISTAYAEDIIYESTSSLDTRYPDGGSTYRSSALYATHKWKLDKRFTLSSGIRFSEVGLNAQFEDQSFFAFPFDNIQQQSQALSGTASLIYHPASSWQLSLLGSTGFRAPNLDDVTKVFDSQPGNVVVPNPDLAPEYTFNTELSIKHHWGKQAQISLSGFASRYENAIVVRNFQFNGLDSIMYEGIYSQVQANVNARQAFFWGVSTYADAHWGPFRLFQTFTYTYGQILDPSNPLPMDHIPPLFGQGGVEYQIKHFKLSGSVNYNGAKSLERYSPRDFNNLFFATPQGSPGWWTLDLKGSWAFNSQLRLLGGVENLFDQHYRTYSSRISAPGRNLYLAIRGKW